MKKLTILACCSLLTSLPTIANDVSVDFSDNVFNLDFISDRMIDDGEVGFGALIRDNDISLYSVKAMINGEVEQVQNLNAALGGKVYLAKFDSEYVQGFGLGGELDYQFPSNPKLKLEAAFYYSPSVTLSDDLDYMTDFTAKISYQLLKKAELFIGYRQIDLHADNGNVEIDEGLHAGMKFTF